MNQTNTGGFTFVELVLVMVLVAILAVSMLTRLPQETLDLGAQADQLVGDIRYVQSLAMTQGQRYCINLTLTSYRMTNTNCATTIVHPVRQTAAPITLGTGITMAWTNLPNNYAAFDGRGQPYTDVVASTLLATPSVITLSKDARTITVSITPETGRVTVP
jgi:type II secretory pathway pseudopilin PulG